MRPRHKAAENESLPVREGADMRASMRPRHKAAENYDEMKEVLADERGLQ